MAKFWEEEKKTRPNVVASFFRFGLPTECSKINQKEVSKNSEKRDRLSLASILIFTSSVHQEVVLVLLRILRLRRLRLWRVATNIKVQYRHLLRRSVNQSYLNPNKKNIYKKKIPLSIPLSNHVHELKIPRPNGYNTFQCFKSCTPICQSSFFWLTLSLE